MKIEYFQMIDRIAAFDDVERRITVEAHIPEQSTIFEGHFPGYPLMPGVLLIESMAQASGWLLLGLMKFDRMPFLAAVKEAKMRAFVSPGEVLLIDAEIVHTGSGYAMTTARITSGGQVKSEASLTFRQVGFPNDELKGHMLELAQRIGFPEALTHG